MALIPLYPHDCVDCVYLGSYTQKKDENFDLYFCNKADSSLSTLVARYGEELDYIWYAVSLLEGNEELRKVFQTCCPAILEAYTRMKARGLS